MTTNLLCFFTFLKFHLFSQTFFVAYRWAFGPLSHGILGLWAGVLALPSSQAPRLWSDP